MSTVVRATLADQAYQELRGQILTGQLTGGDRLLPEELSVSLSISPTPIKEALLRLEGDGLVHWPLRKGAVVRRFSTQDIEDIYDARVMIEVTALRRACERGRLTREFLSGLRHTLAMHALHAGRGTLDDLPAALNFDREFHQQIILAAGNALVAEWHLRILRQTHTVFVFRTGDYGQSVDEHRDIVDALDAGDIDRAVAALEAHLAHSRQNALSTLSAAPQAAAKETD